MVQMDELTRINQAWVAAGEPTCLHERTEEELYLGSRTGDTACLDCGRSWPRRSEPPA